MKTRTLMLTLALAAAPLPAVADPAPNAVTQWAAIVQQSIHNAAAPRSAGTSQVLHATVMLAIYDAVVAIEGGYEPYAAAITAWPGADVNAAIAAAAYFTARPRVAASQWPYLDAQYAAALAAIPDGPSKIDGIAVGQAAAAAILQARADDGFGNMVLYECSAVPAPPGEFEPDAGCPANPGDPQPVDTKLGRIKPFTYAAASAFRPSAPPPLDSRAYTKAFTETRDLGRADSTYRSNAQTDVAFFWSENPYVHWNRNLIALAIARELNTIDAARFFALVHTTVADAIIAGFEAKYYFSAWRPRTAIPRADTDGNDATEADPTWRPLLMVNHPEYPSGHGFWSGALIDAVAAFFGTRQVGWTIVTSKAAVPRLEQTERTYVHLNVLAREIYDARVWGGLHWRFSLDAGERMGRRVARHVLRHHFRPVP